MRVLVTGGSGFIGRRVVRLLRERGGEVVVVGRSERADVRADLLQCNVADVVAHVAPTHVLHLGWTTEHPTFWTDPANVDWLAASARLLRAALDAGAERFVAAGTCAEYAWPCAACDETQTPLAPTTLYAVAKDAFRRLGEAYARDRGAEFAWGRTFFVYGPGEPPGKLISSVIRDLQAGRRPAIRDLHRRLDFVYVDDVARGFADLVVCRNATGAFNLGSGMLHSVFDAVTIACDIVSGPPVEFAAGSDMAMVVGADLTRSRTVLSYVPHVSFGDGIARTADVVMQTPSS